MMSRRMIVNNTCPLCGDYVKVIPDHILKKNPHKDNVEFVVTKAGHKQYFHTTCWYEMIAEKRPYGKKVAH